MPKKPKVTRKEMQQIKRLRMLSLTDKDADWGAVMGNIQRMIAGIAWKKAQQGIGEFDDLMSRGLAAMDKLILNFKISKKSKFSTYAFLGIVNAMGNKKSPEKVSLDSPVGKGNDEEDGGLVLHEVLPSSQPSPYDTAVVNEVWSHVAGLKKEKHRRVIYLRYKQGMTLEETGKVMGITRQGVDLIETKALKAIKNNIMTAR